MSGKGKGRIVKRAVTLEETLLLVCGLRECEATPTLVAERWRDASPFGRAKPFLSPCLSGWKNLCEV
jgi:hypothetical protein